MDRKPTPLSDLLQHLATQREALWEGASDRRLNLEAELAAARKRWSEVRTQSQMQQAELHTPEMETTGPLNAAALIHRAMSVMRELSPGYLQHFLSYADDLSWMERITTAATPPAKDAPRPATIGKRPASKPRKRK